MKTIAILLVTVFAIILACGCVSTSPPQQNTTISMLTSQTVPMPTYTFATVTYSTQLIPAQTSTPIPSPITEAPIDPVLGRWNAVNVPYSCQVIFAEDNTGSLSCGPGFIAVAIYGFDWQNTGSDGLGNTSYQITETNVQEPRVIDASINSSKIMTASILPSNGYLIKING